VRVKDLKVEFFSHTVNRFTVYVDAEEPAELDEKTATNPVRPEDPSEWLPWFIDALNRERATEELPALERNPLADALIADYFFQDRVSWTPPTFEEIIDNCEESNGGFVVELRRWSTWDIERTAGKYMQRPYLRRRLMDEDTTMYGLGMDRDGDSFVVALLSRCDVCGNEADQDGETEATAAMLSTKIGADRMPPVGRIPKQDLEQTIDKGLEAVRKCYQDDGLAWDEDIGGTMKVKWVIGSSGKVIAAVPEEMTTDCETLEICVVDAIRKWKFPAPLPAASGGGVVFVERTFDFVPKGKKGRVIMR